MEIKDDITRRKIELTIEILQAALQGKDIEYNNTNNGWSKSNILSICPETIEYYRIVDNYRPRRSKYEFTQLMVCHANNLTVKETSTQYLYSIINIYETHVALNKVYGTEIKTFTFKELFDNFTFNNDKDYTIGIKINNEEE